MAEEIRYREKALRESERREQERAAELAIVLDTVPIPIFIAHDPECLHISGNCAADKLLRDPRGAESSLSAPVDMEPRHFRAVKDGRELHTDELPAQRAASGVPVRDFEFDLVFEDGKTYSVIGYGIPLLDNEGRPRGAVHALVDITERKKAEEALRQSELQLKAMNEDLERKVEQRTLELQETQLQYLHAEKLSAIGKLSASIAHEFNSPLQAVMTVLKGLRKTTALEEVDKKLLDLAIGESERMKNLIRSFSRSTARNPKSREQALACRSAMVSSKIIKGKFV
jgi:C4-dicarboxylate-specific signal transduction histidine kinase